MTKIVDDANNGRPAWVEDVRVGKFESLPDPLTWDLAADFVYLLSGCDIMDSSRLGSFANRKRREAQTMGVWSGSAQDLWLCLFYENRRWRHFDEWPKDRNLETLDALCAKLRQALVALNAIGRQEMLDLIAAYPSSWS
jgi:hypothetical protein